MSGAYNIQEYQQPFQIRDEGISIAKNIGFLDFTGSTVTGAYGLGGVVEAFTGATGGGSVTSVSVVSANGFAGSVANPTTTPAITISTTITGLLKGNGTAISAATGADYQVPISLTTTGTSGAATFSAGVLNIPQYAGATYTAGIGLTLTTNSFSVNTSQNIATLSNLTGNGFVKTSGGAGTLSIDTNTYITGNQTITLSGDVTGSGATAITTTLATAQPGAHTWAATQTFNGIVISNTYTQVMGYTSSFVSHIPNDGTQRAAFDFNADTLARTNNDFSEILKLRHGADNVFRIVGRPQYYTDIYLNNWTRFWASDSQNAGTGRMDFNYGQLYFQGGSAYFGGTFAMSRNSDANSFASAQNSGTIAGAGSVWTGTSGDIYRAFGITNLGQNILGQQTGVVFQTNTNANSGQYYSGFMSDNQSFMWGGTQPLAFFHVKGKRVINVPQASASDLVSQGSWSIANFFPVQIMNFTSYTGNTTKTYRIRVASSTTFDWSDSDGSSYNATGVTITGGTQTLNNGVTIKFNQTTSLGVGDLVRFKAWTEDLMRYEDADGNIRAYLTNQGNFGIGAGSSPGELLSLGLSGTTLGVASFAGSTSGKVIIQAAAAAGSWTMTLPTGAGTGGYVLSTNGSGVTSWVAQTSGFSNPMNTLGDIMYEDVTPTAVRLAGNTTLTKKYLSQTGTGTVSAAPAWAQVDFADISGTVTNAQLAGSITAAKLVGSDIATVGTITTGTWNATTIAVNKGGTGQTTYTDGQLLIGNTSGNTLTKAVLTGTTNQVVVTNGNGSITLSLPQNIHTAATPQFARLGLGAAADSNAVMAATGQYFSIKNTLTFSASQAIDWGTGNVQYVVLTAAMTSITFSNPKDGARYLLIWKQDGTGSRAVTWPATVLWPGGTAPVMSGANKVDIISLVYDATNTKYYGNFSNNF